ncbi:MAG TPA: succinate dehydrogenase, cytochrome b556 subunit [Methylophilaceae bacterium]|jgi:succinate dehydrogenase / fumarate reductase cytochrome b subunit
MKRARPKNLNLLSIRLPLPALVSILHRASGLLLFVALPFLLFCLQSSLQSAERFQHIADMFSQPVTKLLMVILGWALTHHFLAGIRHLAMDMHWGMTLPAARTTARMVLLSSAIVTFLIARWLW